MNNGEFYVYVSTRANYDPAEMLIVIPPSAKAPGRAAARQFAMESGWQTLAEYNGAVLVVPAAPEGWHCMSTELPGRLYDTLRGECSSRNGRSLLGRGGKLWCWETLIYLVGYEDGAVFAGNCAVAHPGRFAAVALVGGAPDDYTPAQEPSEHSFVRNVSADYHPANNEIPSCVWILGAPADQAARAREYFARVDKAEDAGTICLEGIQAHCWRNPSAPAQQILVSEGAYEPELSLSQKILDGLFNRVIRWKDGPDGTLRPRPSREDYYTDGRFRIGSVCVNALDYPYGVHLPAGKGPQEVAGLPLVFSVHGRGEPAWLFCTKNGWDTLSDETGAFVLAVPDSPGNIWQMGRDAEAFAAMVEQICAEYNLDRTRVYLTGFSNGASITREVGTSYPQLFAAISPWNGPVRVPGLVAHEAICPALVEEEYELPSWICAGDQDAVTGPTDAAEQLGPLLAANRCRAMPAQNVWGFVPDGIRSADYYTPEKGYKQGERFFTGVFQDGQGIVKVCYTVMKNMPHGAIQEQSRACWEFMRHFRRPGAQKQVIWEE